MRFWPLEDLGRPLGGRRRECGASLGAHLCGQTPGGPCAVTWKLTKRVFRASDMPGCGFMVEVITKAVWPDSGSEPGPMVTSTISHGLRSDF